MHIHSVSSSKERKSAEIILVPFWQDDKQPQIACDGEEFDAIVKFPLESGDFRGKEGETLLLYSDIGKEKRVLLVGLGNLKNCLPDQIRCSYASAIKAVRAKKIKDVNVLFPNAECLEWKNIAAAVIEGILLASYSFDQWKTAKEVVENSSALKTVCFCGLDKEGATLLKKLEIGVQSVNFVRDYVNGNADDIHVDFFKKTAQDFDEKYSSVTTTILDKKELEKEKMGLILAVGKAAIRDPALIILEYQGNPHSKDRIAIVGKGITYDTGGLNIKVSGMETMKCDMAGAAVALEIIRAAAELKLNVNILSVLAVAENAMGPNSYKPGDVYRGYGGQTVEITNTDAEGRLVLADAISYVEKNYAPTQMIDFATLTGGVIVALGEEATGLFSNNESLAKELELAGERTHERLWRLPLYPEYKEYLKSPIADIKNSGQRKASASQGATFIHHFIKSVPWAHLDIAGTAYLSELKPYHSTPATGVGIRLLIDFFEHLNEKGS